MYQLKKFETKYYITNANMSTIQKSVHLIVKRPIHVAAHVIERFSVSSRLLVTCRCQSLFSVALTLCSYTEYTNCFAFVTFAYNKHFPFHSTRPKCCWCCCCCSVCCQSQRTIRTRMTAVVHFTMYTSPGSFFYCNRNCENMR